MANIDYDRMARILTRCAEIGLAMDAKTSVKTTYTGVLQAPADAFSLAYRAVIKTESVWQKANTDAAAVIAALDKPFLEARSVVMAFVPTAIVPATLKQLRTDTDRLQAIEELLTIVDDHKAESWAIEIANGEFAKNAPATKTEVGKAIAAASLLNKARATRAAAYDPAYDAYLRFKRVVKDAMGASSIEYKRIHIRSTPTNEAETGPPSVQP